MEAFGRSTTTEAQEERLVRHPLLFEDVSAPSSTRNIHLRISRIEMDERS